jgi:CBS domain-containing protein
MKATTVRDLMTSDVVTLDEKDDFVSADQIMTLTHVRHLPVVRGKKKLVGLVTHRDLIGAQAKLLWSIPSTDETRAVSLRVADIMRTRLATCSPDTPADDAMRLMLDHKMGCMLVTEGDTLLGIMTEADVLKWASEMMAKGRLEDA